MKKIVFGLWCSVIGICPLVAAVITVDNAWIANPANVENGALFFTGAGNTYQFAVDYTAPGTAVFVMAPDITVDLNGHTLRFGSNNQTGTMGINLSGHYRLDTKIGQDGKNYTRTSSQYSATRNLTVKNGTIEWQGTTAEWAACIGTLYGGPFVIDNMKLLVGGPDGWTVSAGAYAGLTLTNTYAVSTTNKTENRHQGPGNVRGGKVTAYNNIIVGGNSAINANSFSDIHHNVLRHSGYATNGYGVFLYRNEGCKVYNNLIVPTNGRGIIFNAGKNHEAYNNLMVVHEKPNAEFGDNLNPPGVRIRYDANNIEVRNNAVLAIGGGENTAGSGLYLTNQPGMKNNIHNNEFRAILTSPVTQTSYANGMTLEEQNADDEIWGNIFSSNNYLIRLNGYDGGVDINWAVRGNTLKFIGGDETAVWLLNHLNSQNYAFSYPPSNLYVTEALLAAVKNEVFTQTQNLIAGVSNNMSRATFFTGYYTYPGIIPLMDTVVEPGVSLDVDGIRHFGGSGETRISIGRTLTIQAKSTNGAILSNKFLMVRDANGISFSGTTDSSGVLQLSLVDYDLFDPAGTGAAFSKQLRVGHEALIADYNPAAIDLSVPRDSPTPIVILFQPGGFTDAVPPELSNISPSNNAYDRPANISISARITDFYPGVNKNSLAIEINGSAVPIAISDIAQGYKIVHTPTKPFALGQTVQAVISGRDLDNNPISQSIQFFIEKPAAYPYAAWKAKDVLQDQNWKASSVARTVRLLIKGSQLVVGAKKIALEFMGRSTSNYQIKGVSIAEADLAACKSCVVDATWTKVFFDGKTESAWADPVTIGANSLKVSDELEYIIDPNKSYFISFRMLSPSVYLTAATIGYEEFFYDTDQTTKLDWTDAKSVVDYHAFSRLYAVEPLGELPPQPIPTPPPSAGSGENAGGDVANAKFANIITPSRPAIAIPCHSNIRVVDQRGSLVAELVCADNQAVWHGANAASGTYTLIQSGVKPKKVVVVK